MRARTAGLTALALCAFAANSLLCRAALGGGHIDPVSFTTVRLASGALALLALAGGAWSRPGRWRPAAALFAYAIAFSLAYTRITAAVGALALFGAVQATLVGWSLKAGERLRPAEWVGLAVSLCGLLVLALPGLTAPDPRGVGLMLVAGAAWAAYTLAGRGSRAPLADNAASFLRTVPLALACSALALWQGPAHATPAGVGLAVASGALASGLGYAVWYAALPRLSAAQAAVVQLAVPPLAALGAVALLGESLSLRLALAGAMILGGIGLAVTARAR